MVFYRCKTCMWFDNQHSSLHGLLDTYGYCRKHHPVVYLRETRYYGGWPLVDKEDLCGEFREEPK